ncbi:MAG: hypothetical protein SFX73_31310 [Kofleriaceae bacterium]|nr:hypothetical protein [Kofleriaceae bacterium]
MRIARKALFVASLLAACGPSGRGDDGGGGDDTTVDAIEPNNYATITGKVWAPNQGPGQALLGQEIPVAGALVYVSQNRPTQIPDGVYCEMCVPTPNGGVLTGADGSFSLDVAPGRYWVVIEKGQFRLEAEYDLQTGVLAMTSAQTTLPSVWDPETGRYMPRIALVRGSSDRIEDILGKLGVGTMAGNTFSNPQGEKGPEISLFDYSGTGTTSATALLTNYDEMRKYHIIFFPCSTSMSSLNTQLSDQAVLANIRRYVNAGGKLYVTDWSGELVDRAFPTQIELGDDAADSTGTYDPVTFTGTLTSTGDADGGLYDAPDGKVTDTGLHQWLGLQTGPEEGGTVGMFNPDAFEVTHNWNWIKKLTAVQIGVDDQSMPVYDTPKAWLTGSKPNTAGATARPLAVTYEPTGCGKVLYSTFQTANGEHDGLYPQERVLLYLIMEITTCTDNPIL